MTNDIRENKPWTVSSISQEKPNVPVSDTILTGYIANSMNGGHNKVIAWKQVMAGEKHKEYRLQANFQMLTPKTPTYQNLIMTIRTYFVPNSRVWENAEKFTAQKGGSTETKITEVPNMGGQNFGTIPVEGKEENQITTFFNTTAWRDSFISSYYPRMGTFRTGTEGVEQDKFFATMPKVSVLPLRGRIAIYNDFERHKEYDNPLQEYKGDTVNGSEMLSYIPRTTNTFENMTMRARANDSYYSDYRTELQGFETNMPNGENSAESLLTWAQWESKIAETRTQAENAQKNDWEIISEIRGSKKLSEGKVQLIGKKSFVINYSAVTQNTYNNNENVSEEFRVLGKQGAYSYTQVDIPLYAGMEFVEEGYIHVIATISADSVFESGFDRLELNVNVLDQYRPDLLDDKKDVLYEIETGTQKEIDDVTADLTRVIGFKRKYSEYFKLPNIIAGDMTTNNYYQSRVVAPTEGLQIKATQDIVTTQKTYQFFETDRNVFVDNDLGIKFRKKPWKDYTDLLINKNQASKNNIMVNDSFQVVYLEGNNQMFFVGKTICIAQLPVDESVKNNYTTFGEH